jgi:tRNA1Val (adenine37-N6)-methyltransferase
LAFSDKPNEKNPIVLVFSFKKFTVQQDQCAMKVGTDGVLLGAWTPLKHNPKNILDIGTGTGLIALMLAQRSAESQIDAFDIDAAAFEQASYNFMASPWADRLYCYHAGLDEFIAEPDQTYDLIVCNPPFHTETILPVDSSRKNARSAEALPLVDLAEATTALLAEEGVFAAIVPYKLENSLVGLMADKNLYPFHITRVKGMAHSPVKRSLIAFSDNEIPAKVDELTIEEARHHYTSEFTQLVADFYLHL